MIRTSICLLFILIASSSLTQTGNLTVVVTGIESSEGMIQVGLYNDAKSFPESGKEFLTKRAEIKGNKVKITFKDLELGKYAFGVYHDKNNDGECNQNFMGIPTEGYCFSRNYEPVVSEPDFSDCSFDLQGNVKMKVKMIN